MKGYSSKELRWRTGNAQESFYFPGSTILIFMLHSHDCVRYPAVEPEDTKIRVSVCAIRIPPTPSMIATTARGLMTMRVI